MSKLKEKGITLVALVVTIIILLILAGVTLSLALGQTGLFSKAQNAADRYKSAQTKEEGLLTDLEKEMDKYESKNSIPEESPKGPNGKTLITSVTTTNHNDTIKGEDRLGNPVTVPKNFKVVEGETVEDGIVIEDKDGNQFVWIPVSNIDGDNNAQTTPEAKDLIIKNDKSKVEITLGRYMFDTSNGTPKLVQKGLQYSEENDEFIIDLYFKENTNIERTGKAAGAKLVSFVESVKNNHGYYIGRYEASFGSGETPTESYSSSMTRIMTNQKPAVKATKKENDNKVYVNETATLIKPGELWRYITQEDASKVCQNMYNAKDIDIESDLVNSYAWDTAIVYIEEMKHNNYANANRDVNNIELKNTGDTEDEKCHIYDMAGNLHEWTTEYSINTKYNPLYLCVCRGGCCIDENLFVAYRHDDHDTTFIGIYLGFRPLIYMK